MPATNLHRSSNHNLYTSRSKPDFQSQSLPSSICQFTMNYHQHRPTSSMDAAIADSLMSPGFVRLCTMTSDESNSMAWSGSDVNTNKECNNNNLSRQRSFCATNLTAISRPVPGLTMSITQPSSFVSISPMRKSSRGGGGPYIWTSPIRYLSTPTSLPSLASKSSGRKRCNAKPTRTASTWAQVCAATAADAAAVAAADELFVKLQERFAHAMRSSKSIAAKAKKSKPATVVKAKKSKAKQGINKPGSKSRRQSRAKEKVVFI